MTSSKLSFNDVTTSIIAGGVTMASQAPAVNALNCGSVVACHRNLSSYEAMNQIYRGVIHNTSPSPRNFLKGLVPHLIKEIGRLGVKAPTLTYKARIDDYFSAKNSMNGTVKAALAFSGGLGLFEALIINPLDTLRVVWQSGQTMHSSLQPGQRLVSHLWAGSIGNGWRQFFTWLSFDVTNRAANHILRDHTSIDPTSWTGIGVKFLPQGYILTIIPYGFERIKNVLQTNPKVASNIKFGRYAAAFRSILAEQGTKGLTRGYVLKGGTNAILTSGVLALPKLTEMVKLHLS